jgi:hypothetical protein
MCSLAPQKSCSVKSQRRGPRACVVAYRTSSALATLESATLWQRAGGRALAKSGVFHSSHNGCVYRDLVQFSFAVTYCTVVPRDSVKA